MKRIKLTLQKGKRIYKKICDKFFWEKEMFPKKFVDKIINYLLGSITSFLKIVSNEIM